MTKKFLAAAAALLLCVAPAHADDEAKAIAEGERVYTTYCSSCHGDNLVNTGSASFDLRRLRADERTRFESSVLDGKRQMPPWRGVLSAAEIAALWRYVQAGTTAP